MHTILPATADHVQHQSSPSFAGSRDRFERIVGWLEGTDAGQIAHCELEQRLDVEGRELLRQMFQDHLDLRAQREPRVGAVRPHRGAVRAVEPASAGPGQARPDRSSRNLRSCA